MVTVVMKGPQGPNQGGAPISQEFAWGYGVDEDGTTITGGRGYDPVYVTNLNASGSGSLSAAMATNNGAQILFEVGGAISATGTSITHDIDNDGNITVWGSTACSGNANIQGKAGTVRILGVNNVIVKHLRVHLDDSSGNPGVDNRDCFIVNNSGGSACSNILIENCSMSGSTDEMFSIWNTGGQIGSNINVYRCLMGYAIRDSGRGEGHNFGPAMQGHTSISIIESVIAHCHSRPLFRPRTEQVHLSNFHYIWQGYEINRISMNQGWHNARLFVEGCRYKERDSSGQGIKTPDYTGIYQGTSTSGCIIGDSLNSTDMVYFDNNYFPSLNRASGLGSSDVSRATILANMTLPSAYGDRMDTNFWEDTGSNIENNLALIGANPTTSDDIDDDIRNSIINDTGYWIDSISEMPSGGFPSLTSETHASKGTFGGDTLQEHLESRSWWANRHQAHPNYTNRTRLEAYLDTFVSGVPGTDPN